MGMWGAQALEKCYQVAESNPVFDEDDPDHVAFVARAALSELACASPRCDTCWSWKRTDVPHASEHWCWVGPLRNPERR